mmetsp:Transcript_11099/g.22719  ORF Transcript_11099/g.22719 Transcript_11099/m.22719 type:complete len:229 (+) Transcript_11099:909-1595(+)
MDPGTVEPRPLVGKRAEGVSSHDRYSLIWGETEFRCKIVDETIRSNVRGRKHSSFARRVTEQVSVGTRRATNVFEIKIDFVEEVGLGDVDGSQRGQSPTIRTSDNTTIVSTHVTETSHGKQKPGVVRVVQVDATVAAFRSNTVMKTKSNKLGLRNESHLLVQLWSFHWKVHFVVLTARLGSCSNVVPISPLAAAIPSSTVPAKRGGAAGVGRVVRGLGAGRVSPPVLR